MLKVKIVYDLDLDCDSKIKNILSSVDISEVEFEVLKPNSAVSNLRTKETFGEYDILYNFAADYYILAKVVDLDMSNIHLLISEKVKLKTSFSFDFCLEQLTGLIDDFEEKIKFFEGESKEIYNELVSEEIEFFARTNYRNGVINSRDMQFILDNQDEVAEFLIDTKPEEILNQMYRNSGKISASASLTSPDNIITFDTSVEKYVELCKKNSCSENRNFSIIGCC